VHSRVWIVFVFFLALFFFILFFKFFACSVRRWLMDWDGAMEELFRAARRDDTKRLLAVLEAREVDLTKHHPLHPLFCVHSVAGE
jgi:hypothetical protein